LNTVLVTAAMTTVLVAMALGNEHLLRSTEVASGVNWIYLPAGLRLCYVLVMPVQGTLAIFAASLIMASRDPGLPWALVLISACVTAAGPLLARAVSMHLLTVRPNLDNLTSGMLCFMAVLFGLFSTSLHQAFYVAIGRDQAWLSMWVGDTLGCLLCLYLLKGATSALRRRSNP
jgi:hypothetical protein